MAVMLPVRNEAGRFLRDTLEQLVAIADVVVVYDDASDDSTPDICRSFPRVDYHEGEMPAFGVDESVVRRRLWQLTAAHRPDWILWCDADEAFEDRAVAELPALMRQKDYDVVAFRVFDFWKGTTHVRTDGPWNPWTRFQSRMARYDPALPDRWLARPIHCGGLPLAYRDAVTFYSHLRIRHYGWSRGEEHLRKYLFYRERDLAAFGKVQPQTESILQPQVQVEPWVEMRCAPWLLKAEAAQARR